MKARDYVERELLSRKGPLLHVPLTHELGLMETAVLTVLVMLGHSSERWFPVSMRGLQRSIGMRTEERRSVIRSLQSEGLLEVKDTGGARSTVRLHYTRVATLLRTGLSKARLEPKTKPQYQALIYYIKIRLSSKKSSTKEFLQGRGRKFLKTFRKWLAYRKERKYPVNTRVQRRHLKILSHLRDSDAVEVMRTSMRHGWQGLFPPKPTPAEVNDEALEKWRRKLAIHSRRWYKRKGDDVWGLSEYHRPHNAWSDLHLLKRDIMQWVARQGSKSHIPDDLSHYAWRPPHGWAWRKFLDWHINSVDPQHAGLYRHAQGRKRHGKTNSRR